MAKIVKKKKRKKLRLVRFSAMLFFLSSLLYLGSSLFLRSYNNSLSTQAQQIQSQIDDLQVQNDAVSVEVNTLNNRERVASIAADSGLTMDKDNIVTITKTDSGE